MLHILAFVLVSWSAAAVDCGEIAAPTRPLIPRAERPQVVASMDALENFADLAPSDLMELSKPDLDEAARILMRVREYLIFYFADHGLRNTSLDEELRVAIAKLERSSVMRRLLDYFAITI